MNLLRRAYETYRWWRTLPYFIRALYRRVEELDARLSEFETGDREHV